MQETECKGKMGYNQENRPGHLSDRDASTVVPSICPDNALHMEKHVTHVEKSITSKCLQSGRSKMLHSINPQEEQHQDEDNIDKVKISSINLNSIIWNSKYLFITANINTLSSQAT